MRLTKRYEMIDPLVTMVALHEISVDHGCFSYEWNLGWQYPVKCPHSV